MVCTNCDLWVLTDAETHEVIFASYDQEKAKLLYEINKRKMLVDFAHYKRV